MKLKPAYKVFYGGELHRAGEVFHIDPKDADELAKHGEIIEDDAVVERPVKRQGRPRKADK